MVCVRELSEKNYNVTIQRMEVTMEGKVKWFNDPKGYGFINRGDGVDIFVHYSQIVQEGHKTLATGQDVQFDLVETNRGLQARNVVKL